MNSALRKALEVTETMMCAKLCSEIEFSKISSICMNRQKLAFLNETKEGEVAHPTDDT